VIPSRGVILYHLDMGKNSNLDKINLPESPFTKMTYQVRGYMDFRSNELALIRRASNFLQKSFSDPQHVISLLNFDR
jgi:hypothetical protein